MAAERPLRADAARNRVAIIQAAAEVFAGHGAEASMGMVAQRAGVGVGTVYRHFTDKRALLGAVLNAELERLAADARRRSDRNAPGDELRSFLRAVAKHGRANAAVKDALGAIGGDVKEATREGASAFRAELAKLLERAQHQGCVRRDLTVDDLLDLLTAVVAVASSPQRSSARQRRLVDVLVDGLYRSSDPPTGSRAWHDPADRPGSRK